MNTENQMTPSAPTERAKAIARDEAAFDAYRKKARSFAVGEARSAWLAACAYARAEAAAIQRGDGQTAHTEQRTIVGYVDRDNGVFGPGYAKWKEPVWSTPPVAKPNETSGVTPEDQSLKVREIRQRYADSSKHLVNWWDSDIKVLLLEIQRLELAAVRAAGNHIGDANEMVAAVRKSAGAEWAEAAHWKKAREESEEVIAAIVKAAGPRPEGFDIIRHVQALAYAVKNNIAAAKSTPGVDAWQDIETAPKDGTRILCSYHGNRSFIARWRSDFSVFMDDSDLWRDATHWRPLPHPSAANPSDADGASGGKEGV